MSTIFQVQTQVVENPKEFKLSPDNHRWILLSILFGFAALAFGVFQGFVQGLNYAGISLFSFLPGMKTYYEGLTAHGVLNAFIFTFAEANGWLALTTARGLGRNLNSKILALSFILLVLGTLFAGIPIFVGKASVLYTFYPPLRAHWAFYLGIALAVVSTWLISAAQLMALAAWRKEHKGERIPLMAYVSIMTYIMWDISSLGAAAEDLFLLLPWSLNLLPGSDPLLSRVLFWYTGHQIVYYWLLPAYVSWYIFIPRMVGGKLFSDSLARIAFILFVVLVPVGFHHQYTDPGVGNYYKIAVLILTFGIAFPSLLTAFSIMYALEIGGRANGGKGILGWFWKLPWANPTVSAQVLAMIAFLPGGITGIMNASYNMNLLTHNTTFVPGHFHLTLGSAVTLSYFGIAYWLIPYLTGKPLALKGVAKWQPWIYFLGVMIFARGEISGGILGMPRRTAMAIINYEPLPGWKLAGALTGIGGTIMFISCVLFFLVIFVTLVQKKQTVTYPDMPFTETYLGAAPSGWQLILDRLSYWVLLSFVLIALVYGPFLLTHIPPKLTAPPFQGF
ncbi:cbb3-type cytochrome c oxidase subunit I [Methylacidiphilum caldifontis]|uniref:Cytochrome c oxidase subunit I n=1 Tax=Methylacidiphilum caldifontis TaxID=2795386 RepID=A0A4Y8PC50_9BACT|nr:cbb3-type cytochrome c oxidase subunit I [Methylacidiphilum caldifontis]QSR88985.1 cbb3-type cytochrome c oxidase subunit I [Methylacidiphilum caldifontis]TFE68582.1 cytochrome c oxidase subunit I [Methylacidiphilum caldifontis]